MKLTSGIKKIFSGRPNPADFVAPCYYDENNQLVFPPEVKTLNDKVSMIIFQRGETSTSRLACMLNMNAETLYPVIDDLTKRGRIKTIFINEAAGRSPDSDYHRINRPDPAFVRLGMRAAKAIENTYNSFNKGP